MGLRITQKFFVSNSSDVLSMWGLSFSRTLCQLYTYTQILATTDVCVVTKHDTISCSVLQHFFRGCKLLSYILLWSHCVYFTTDIREVFRIQVHAVPVTVLKLCSLIAIFSIQPEEFCDKNLLSFTYCNFPVP